MAARSGSRLHQSLFISLYGVLAGSLFLALFHDRLPHAWSLLRGGYVYLSLGFAWYFLLLAFQAERQTSYPRYRRQRIGVLIPMYNEDKALLVRCLKSVARCRGNKRVLLLDDGTDNGMDKAKLAQLCESLGIEFMGFAKNRGKRHVVHDGVKKLAGEVDVFVTIDSDTVLEPDALTKLVAPFADPTVGAASGDVRILNEDANWVTRMVGAYYWLGLRIRRQAQSAIGSVTCCSGCLAAYRATALSGIIDEFLYQQFLGEPCSFSEDRHITNLMLRNGWQAVFVPKAISWTNTPDTLRSFLKQQMRWKRGFLRESTFTLTYAWKRKKQLFIQVLFCDLILPFALCGVMVSMAFSALHRPAILLGLAVYILVFTMTHRLLLLLREPAKLPGALLYALLFEAVLYWQNFYALLTVKRKGWLTR